MNQFPIDPNGMQSPNYASQPVYEAPWHPVDPMGAPQKKKRRWKKSTAFLLAGCMVLAGAAGAGGGYLASALAGSDGKTVLFQSPTATPTGTSSGEEASGIAGVVNKTASSVVEITTESLTNGSRLNQYVSKGAGSGVILSKDGYIATNNHVISGAQKITVRTKDGKTYDATLVGTDEESDLAVLKIEANGLNPVVFGDSSTLQVGETAIAIGNPLGELGGTVTSGIISALDRQITIDGQTMTLLQTNAAINPGNSGGGLFNSKGELMGIVNAKSSGSGVEGLGFAIPSNTAKEIITQLIENGKVSGRVDPGFTPIDLTDAQQAMQYGVSRQGIYVNQINSLECLLQTGDLIQSINGKEINSMADYTSALKDKKVGASVPFTVLRNGRQVSVNVTLLEK